MAQKQSQVFNININSNKTRKTKVKRKRKRGGHFQRKRLPPHRSELLRLPQQATQPSFVNHNIIFAHPVMEARQRGMFRRDDEEDDDRRAFFAELGELKSDYGEVEIK